MICAKCRRSSQDDAIFCPYCGKKLIQTQKRRTKSRGNGTGTAFKRGSTWTAQVVYDRVVVADDKPLKKLTRSKGGFRTRDEALRYCPILKNGPEKPVLAPTLASYWEAYKKGPYEALSASKQQAYRTAWKKLSDIAETRVDQLTVSDLQDLVAKQCSSYYTARDVRTLLINLFRIASAEGYVRQELPTFIQLPPLEEKERTPFSETEQQALWKLYEDKHDLRAAIPLLMIYTGMMPGEAMALKVEHIDLDKQQITGVGMKTKVRKQAPIVLMKALLPLVQDLIDNAQPSGYIWKRVEKEWYDAYYGALEAAGCRKLTPYSCRHTTASALAITKNVAPQTVTKVMRWSSSKMLDRYAHPDQKDAQRAVNRLKKPV